MGGLRVRDIEFDSNVFLAPMAGITDTVFRQLIRKYAPKAPLYTEMISSEGLAVKQDIVLVKAEKNEYPVIYQISGHKPHLMEKKKKILEPRATMIDINMGCPVNKVVKGSDGSALMKNPKLASEIITAVREAVNIPVSVKTRLGWDMKSKNYLEFSKMVEDSGADMIMVHGRTRSQMYAETANWEEIGKVKQNVSIPVIANGDIVSVETAKKCLEISGCDGIAVGRGTLGDMKLIGRIESYLKDGVVKPPPTVEDKLKTALEHARMEIALRGERVGLKFMRKFFAWYVTGVKNAAKYRFELVRVEKLSEAEEIFERILEEQKTGVL